MSATENTTTHSGDSDDPARIILHIHLTKRMGLLPPLALKTWLLAKSAVFLAAFLVAVIEMFRPGFVPGTSIRWVLGLVLVWAFQDQVINRHEYGLSHILILTTGVVFTENNLYVRWEDISSYTTRGGRLLRLRAAVPGTIGLFGPRSLAIPLTDKTRATVLDTFREHAGPPAA